MRPSRCFGDSPFVRGVNTAHDALIASLFSTIELSVPGFWNLPPLPSFFSISLFFGGGSFEKLKVFEGIDAFIRPFHRDRRVKELNYPLSQIFDGQQRVGRGLKGNLI